MLFIRVSRSLLRSFRCVVRAACDVLAALFKGDARQRTLEVYVEGRLVTTWTSSGHTSDFETIDLPGRPAQTVELRGVLSRSQWLSILEVRFLRRDA